MTGESEPVTESGEDKFFNGLSLGRLKVNFVFTASLKLPCLCLQANSYKNTMLFE